MSGDNVQNNSLQGQTFVCPKCESNMGVFSFGVKCLSDTCTFWIPRVIREKVLSVQHVRSLIEFKATDLIKGFHKKGNSQTFSAHLYISPEWTIKFRLPKDPNLLCPKCGGEIYYTDECYRCVDEQLCGFVIWRNFGGRKLTDSMIKKLITEHKTGLVKGFVQKKSGKRFNAHLALNGDWKVEFRFDLDENEGIEQLL